VEGWHQNVPKSIHKRLAEKIAEKHRESYASVMTYIRAKHICTSEEHLCCNMRF